MISFIISGAGSLGQRVSALLGQAGWKQHYFVDEWVQGTLGPISVFRAETLTKQQLMAPDICIVAMSNPDHAAAATRRLVKQGMDSAKILNVLSDPDLQSIKLMLDQAGPIDLVTHLQQTPDTDLVTLQQCLLGAGWQKVLDELSTERIVLGLGFYSRGGGFAGHIMPVVQAIQNSDFAEEFTLLGMTDDPDIDARFALSDHFPLMKIGANAGKKQDILDFQVSADFHAFGPPGTPRIIFPHFLHDMALNEGFFIDTLKDVNLNYVVAPSRAFFDWFKKLLCDTPIASEVVLIPGGYPKLDRLIRQYQDVSRNKDRIVYAPTQSLIPHPWSEWTNSLDHGLEIFRALRKAFPNKRLVFRPHPNDLTHLEQGSFGATGRYLQDLLHFVEQDPWCELDRSPDPWVRQYAYADLMVSDTSSTAFTFALVTGRPVMFWSPKDQAFRAAAGRRLSFIDDRYKIGSVVENIQQLVCEVETVLSGACREQRMLNIRQFRDSFLFFPGEAAEVCARLLPFICSGQRLKDWVSIQHGRVVQDT